MSELNLLLDRIKDIYIQNGGEITDPAQMEIEKKDLSKFKKKRKVLGIKLRTLRERIEDFNQSQTTDAESIRIKIQLDEEISEARDEIDELEIMMTKQKVNPKKDDDDMQTREKIIKLAKQHLDMYDNQLSNYNNMFTSVQESTERAELMDSAQNTTLLSDRLEDIDVVEGQAQIQLQIDEQDKIMVGVLSTVRNIKLTTMQQADEIEKHADLVPALKEKMQKTSEKIADTDRRLNKVVELMRSPIYCITDLVLIVIILGIVYYIYCLMSK
eukprot:TRINITY_DN3152_c3_g1_i1.p1 TRINITY_DN3152_c3_g1~~TRINITY_DN3152_c3_g1_i1.p1  ORF type:complete len:282 (-),score=91.03 TRINITY_DN3152_c3_g1_i1:50-862(-)